MYVVIDDFVHFDHFLYANYKKHARISVFYYLLFNPSCLAEACYELSMLSKYAP